MQPGVQLAVGVPTTESLVTDIQSAMAGAVGSNQLVNAYKAQNGAWLRPLLTVSCIHTPADRCMHGVSDECISLPAIDLVETHQSM